MDILRYDIAISFAGENRNIAETIARRLDGSGYSVFYDEYEIDRLWGSDLSVKLGEIYGGMARFCLMIVSEHYVRKMWTNHERQFAISELLQKGGDYILPLKVDSSDIPGLPPTIAYLSLNDRSVDDVYQILLRKLGNPIQSTQLKKSISPDDERNIQEIIEACYRRAVFTKMDSEIRLSAMFESLRYCMRTVQIIVPRIREQSLQYLALQIMKDLDELERIGRRYPIENDRDDWSYNIPTVERQKIDRIKIDIINKLLELRRRAGIAITLPTALEFDHFYSVNDANQKPHERNRF